MLPAGGAHRLIADGASSRDRKYDDAGEPATQFGRYSAMSWARNGPGFFNIA
jgi:hypothetical protein